MEELAFERFFFGTVRFQFIKSYKKVTNIFLVYGKKR